MIHDPELIRSTHHREATPLHGRTNCKNYRRLYSRRLNRQLPTRTREGAPSRISRDVYCRFCNIVVG
uniref:Uncharacterized protein n=1 Tax=Arundo donax TaxID=35708 RepID=A0A0A9AXV5_ARUDO